MQMNQIDQRIAIAKLAGFRLEQQSDGEWILFRPDGSQTSGGFIQTGDNVWMYVLGEIPCYQDDLDAIHEVEKSLTIEQQIEYATLLTGHFTEEFCDLEGTAQWIYGVATLTAKQKAESLSHLFELECKS
jgi:hypothetical protein